MEWYGQLNWEWSLAEVENPKLGPFVFKNPLHRTAINKFRLGNHQLRTETGRYTVPKTPGNLRIYSVSNKVENETHVMLTCTFYNKLRSKFSNEVIVQFNSFKDLDNNSRILFLSNSIDPFICRSAAAFIFEIMDHRYKMLFHK